MSFSIKAAAALGLLVAVAACDTTPREEFVVAEPSPITVESSFTGKY